MTPSKDVSRLVEIMRALRAPETGCPWDVEQTFESIIPYTLEEAYEVAEAIAKSDMPNLEEELGDLLLQVVYHAQMADEAGHFSMDDVVLGITKKMIRRHPHVFGDEEARSAGMAKGMWEKIKAEEKAEKAAKRQAAGLDNTPASKSILSDIPATLPANMRALKLQQKAARVGYDWDSDDLVLDKIEEEIGELRSAIKSKDTGDMKDELGDLAFALANLGRHMGIDLEDALRGTNDKFTRRFAYIETALDKAGSAPENASLDEMEALWQEAKTLDPAKPKPGTPDNR